MEQLIIFFVLLAIGYGFGRFNEARHYRSIREREQQYRTLLVMPEKMPPPGYHNHASELVCGNVVVSVDYFKNIAAGLRGLFGGRIGAYESLLDRARREAILRLQEQAKDCGGVAIYNMKFETSRIGENAAKGLGAVEVLAYGTALIPNTPRT